MGPFSHIPLAEIHSDKKGGEPIVAPFPHRLWGSSSPKQVQQSPHPMAQTLKIHSGKNRPVLGL